MSLKYAILATEGPHDQAAVGKILRLLNLRRFNGEAVDLDPFWQKFVPTYPKKGNLYSRLDMPSVFSSQTHSVVVYQGGGSELLLNLQAAMEHEPYYEDIYALGIIVDVDRGEASEVADRYASEMKAFFPGIPAEPGLIADGPPRTGIYVLPDNQNRGVLDTLLVKCATEVYPDHKTGAELFLKQLDEPYRSHWKPFDAEKALVATIVSVLKPGKTNTVSINDNDWICERSMAAVGELATFVQFIRDLLEV